MNYYQQAIRDNEFTIKILRMVSILGMIILIGAAYWTFKTKSFVKTAEKTEGSIIEYVQTGTSDDGDPMYAVVFGFEDLNGRTHQVQSNFSTNRRGYSKGDKVPVIYQSLNPHKAKIHSFVQLWFGQTVLFFVGGMFFLISKLIGGQYHKKIEELKKQMRQNPEAGR